MTINLHRAVPTVIVINNDGVVSAVSCGGSSSVGVVEDCWEGHGTLVLKGPLSLSESVLIALVFQKSVFRLMFLLFGHWLRNAEERERSERLGLVFCWCSFPREGQIRK